MNWKQITDTLSLSDTGFLRHTCSGHGVICGSLRKPHNVGGRVYYLVEGNYFRVCDLLKKHFGKCEIEPDQHWYRRAGLLIFQHNLLLRFEESRRDRRKQKEPRNAHDIRHVQIEDLFSNDTWAG